MAFPTIDANMASAVLDVRFNILYSLYTDRMF